MIVVRLFFTMPRVCLQFVIGVFPDHTHLLVVAQEKTSFRDFYSIFSIGGDFDCAILVTEIMANLNVKFLIWVSGSGGDVM